MDIPAVAYHLEAWDAAYGAYVGFMVVDKTHTHPIALSFLNLLINGKLALSNLASC